MTSSDNERNSSQQNLFKKKKKLVHALKFKQKVKFSAKCQPPAPFTDSITSDYSCCYH